MASKEMPEEEKQLFNSAIETAKKNNVSLEGKKVSQIISDEKNRIEEEKRKEEEAERKRKEELERKEKEKAEKLNNTLKIVLDGKKVIPKDSDAWRFSDYVEFSFSFTNKTDASVKAFQGTAIFKDVFGNEILRMKMDYDEGVGAGQTKQYIGYLDVNQFMDEHLKLRDTEFQNLQFEFEMKTIIFADGTRVDR